MNDIIIQKADLWIKLWELDKKLRSMKLSVREASLHNGLFLSSFVKTFEE